MIIYILLLSGLFFFVACIIAMIIIWEQDKTIKSLKLEVNFRKARIKLLKMHWHQLATDLKKALRNDMPKHPITGRFTKKKGGIFDKKS